MSIAAFIQRFDKLLPFLKGVRKGVEFEVLARDGTGLFRLNYNLSGISSEISNQILQLKGKGLTYVLESFALSRAIIDGPKVFAPKQLDFELLAETTLNLNFDEYAQPFDTVIIELPPDYVVKQTVACEQADWASEHGPDFVIIHHDPRQKYILIDLVLTSQQSYKVALFEREGGKTIEECLVSSFAISFSGLTHDSAALDIGLAEMAMFSHVIRASLNAALLMDEAGTKKLGPKSQKHYDRVKKFAPGRERTIPIYYTLDQRVKLVHHERGVSDGKSGVIMPPHRRKGYYRQQPYGPGNSLRRRQRIPATLINWHLFLGEDHQATTTYTD